MSQIYIPTTPERQLSTKFVMSSRLENLKNSFSHFGVQLWNALPDSIKKSAQRKLFKKKIHEVLINIFKQQNLYLTPSSILEIIKNL